MPKTTFKNLPEDKRDQFREIAEDEFARHPFSQASLSRIVAKAGIAKGSVYQYFENKFDLFRWLVEVAAKKKLAYIGEELPEPGRFLPWLESMLHGGLRFAVENPRLAKIGAQMLDGGDAKLASVGRKFRTAGLDFMTSLVADAQRHGEVRDDIDPRVVTHIIAAMQNSIFETLLQTANAESFHAFLDDDKVPKLDEEESQRIIAQWMHVIRNGVKATGPLHVDTSSHAKKFNLNHAMDEAFQSGVSDD